MPEVPDPKDLQEQLRANWMTYIDLTLPIRADLHAYCRRLTCNIWDAEDLVQDTLIRGFTHLGHLGQKVGNLRAYMLRAASNTWIDAVRRRNTEERILKEQPPTPQPAPRADDRAELRDAGAQLLHRLAPQERAAVVLKDVFELRVRDIAEILTTTEGAVKDALHRGRGRLREPEGTSERRAAPSTELVDRFVELYDAKDVTGLVDLLVEGGGAENLGLGIQYGAEAFEGTENFFYKIVHGHEEWPAFMVPESQRMVSHVLEGEPLLLRFATRHGGSEALELVMRLEEVDGKIARVVSYGFCPETMREVAAALGVEARTGAYRIPDFDA
jgi:RNA polymerase sigma-70 factor (ECF subfamily)